jgi:hypothetical protein
MDLLTGPVGRGPRDLPGPIFPCNPTERSCVRLVMACRSTSEGQNPLAHCVSSTVRVCAIVAPACSKRSAKNRERPSNHGASARSSGRSFRLHRVRQNPHHTPLTLRLHCLSLHHPNFHLLNRLLLLSCGGIGNAVKSVGASFVCFVPKRSTSPLAQ